MSEYNPDVHHRRSIRLRGWDYRTAGAYFVTLVAQHRELLFGTIVDGEMRLSPYGEIVQEEWLRSAELRPEIILDAFVIMPNHFHAVIILTDEPTARPLGALIGGFKAAAARRVNIERETPGIPLWQRNYYERMVRNDRELEAIRSYIESNPGRWAEDQENPTRVQGQAIREK
jgi:REP element-mobilizing transposase RayT